MSGTIGDINQMSTVAASNTNVGGISCAPGWSPANVGPAVRELMALLARMNQGLGSLTDPEVGSLSSSGTVAAAGGIISSGEDAGGAQFRAVNGNYGVIIRNDATTCYIIRTPSGSPDGQWATDTYPIAFNLSTGALTLDSGGIGTTFGGAISATAATIGGKQVVTNNSGTWSLNITGSAGYATSSGSANSVAWSNISGVPGLCYNNGGTYGISISGNASYASNAGSANSVAWSNISGVPGLCYNNGGTYGISISGNASYASNAGNANYASASTTVNTTNGNSWNSAWTGIMEISVGGTAIGAWQMNTSDYRIKEGIESAPSGALDAVLRLRPVTFQWKGLRAALGTTRGLIAHEVQAVIPSAVDVPKDAVHESGAIRPQGIDCLVMISVLVQAVQELAAKVTALEGTRA